MKAQFTWAVPVHGSPHDVRCKYDNKLISVKSGSKNLRQHELQNIHQKACNAQSAQTSIVSALSNAKDEVTMKNRAVFYHVLHIVLNDTSFRSSDAMTRKRSLYAVMFPDSKFSKINCGRTKVMYLLNHAIAPFARQQLSLQLADSLFGILVDESTHNNKVRLEYWIIYFDKENNRQLRYLNTEELEVQFDVEDFLLSSSQSVTLDKLTLVSAENIFKATMQTLEKFNLSPVNLVFLMTDNCNVMTGNQKGFKAQMKDYCPNLIETTGCMCHTANLLQKDELNDSTVQDIVNFAKCLSNFLENKPKVRSILKQCEKMLNFSKINDYCPTRFLSLYEVLDEISNQFHVIKKILLMSHDQHLIGRVSSETFLVHLDQFLVHTVPIFNFTKAIQHADISLYECLVSLLQLITKLLARLGHSLELSPRSYFKKLFVSQLTPIEFQAVKNPNLQFSKDNQNVMNALDKLSDSQIRRIKEEWDRFNEKQLTRLLDRFSTFLGSQLVRHCYVLYVKLGSFTDRCLRSLDLLCEAVGSASVPVKDELSSVRVRTSEQS
ncbi:MAG: hypothetical protein AAGK05_09780, partial [Pseudomonadota bacterium]